MSPFTVSSVYTPERFRVKYGWKIGDKKGKYLSLANYDGPRPGTPEYQNAVSMLYDLILGKEVEVAQVVSAKKDRLYCNIYYRGKNLLEYIAAYGKNKN